MHVMASTTTEPRPAVDRSWFITSRWQEYEGEGRANLLRLIGLIVFYAVELVNYHGLDLGFVHMPKVVGRPFHLAVTFLTLGWSMLCLGVLCARLQGVFPRWLKYLSTGTDVLLLTTILALGDGPRSALVVAYFLIVALAALRFSLPLIWFATAASAAGYLFLLGFARWGSIPGWERGDQTVPRHQQVIFLAALVLTGVILGQVIRRVRHLAAEYARRLEGHREARP
jgi:hypothetical protein